LGLTFPGAFNESNYTGGRIQRFDMESGELKDLYTECNGRKLRGPNDIVFDAHGGMWFTDYGIRQERTADFTGIYYAKIDGSMIKEVVFPLESPNGIGLSPDGNTLYWAETFTGRVFKLAITAPGETAQFSTLDPSNVLCGLPGLQWFDSLAVDGDGNVCVATLGLQTAGVTVISPTGEVLEQKAAGDRADRHGNADHGCPDTDGSRTLLGVGEDVDQDRQRCGEDHRRANTHQGTGPDQLARGRRERCERGGDREDHQAELQDALASEAVTEVTHGQQQCREHERVGVHDPLQLGRAGAELLVQRGKRHIHDRVVDDSE